MKFSNCLKFSLFFLCSSLSIFGQNKESETGKYIFGYDAKIIQEVGGSFNSIKIALDTFAKKINSEFSLKWYKTSDELITGLDENNISCASIMPLTYLFSEKKNIKPLVAAIAAYSDDIFVRYVAVVRNDSEIDKIEKLEGKIFASYKGQEVGGLFLDTELARAKLKSINEFFGKKINYETQEEAFYSVYFKKSSVCLISDDTLKMMIELNPAIKDQIKILLRSEKYIVGGLFVNKSITSEFEKSLLSTSLSLHSTTSGKQTLRLVRMKRLSQMVDSDFDSIRALLKEYKEITNTDYKRLYDKYQVLIAE